MMLRLLVGAGGERGVRYGKSLLYQFTAVRTSKVAVRVASQPKHPKVPVHFGGVIRGTKCDFLKALSGAESDHWALSGGTVGLVLYRLHLCRTHAPTASSALSSNYHQARFGGAN